MYDILLRGGRYPDFDTREFVRADIALKDGRIAAILPADEACEAAEVINVPGRIVSPGFIDLHMHEDDLTRPAEEIPITRLMANMGVTTGVSGNCGEQPLGVDEMKRIIAERGGMHINYVQLAGYNTRREELGIGWYDHAGDEQIEQLTTALARELKNGCYGVSFGLEYAPGITHDEMVRVVKELGPACRFVSVHFRDDSDRSMDSVVELAELARDTGVKVQISHLGSLAGYGDYMKPALEYLRAEMKNDPLLAFDIYPYAAFCTAIGSAVFDMDWRAKWKADYDIIKPIYEPFRGKKVDKELYERMRSEVPEQHVVCFAMTEENIRLGLADDNALYGSDGGITGGGCHPRSAGTFPRILGRYVRENKLISLMDALERMTKKAAERVDLSGKGEIRIGFDADLTIFDPDTIGDNADFDDPTLAPTGIDYVFVSGVCVTGGSTPVKLPGRIIER